MQIMMGEVQPQQHTKPVRSRSGCLTCRRAGYKCDEAKPGCGRCQRLMIPCQGYGVKLVWRESVTIESGVPARGRKRKQSGNTSSTATVRSDPEPASSGSEVSPLSRISTLVSSPSPWMSASGLPQSMHIDDYRVLHHWTTTLSPLLSVASRVEDNPFHQFLTPMVYELGPLRYTVLFMAAKHLAILCNDRPGEKQILRYQNLALQSLSQALQDSLQSVSDPTLAAVLLMHSSSLFASQEDPRPNHLQGAKWIITKRRSKTSWSASCGRFLLSLFRYQDTMWSISHTDKPLYDLDMPAVEDSDPLLGEIAYLLQIVSQIGMLQSWKKAMDVDVDESNVTEETRFASIMATSSLLEAQLENWENPITSSDLEWHQTAEAYRHAAFVFLYRVTYNIGASHPLTVQHVRRCLDALAEVPSESSLASVHIWPLFTAGCESVEYSDREFCRRRLLKMYSERRLPSLPRVLAAMESVWAQKDEETQRGISLDCIAVLKQQGKEVDLAY